MSISPEDVLVDIGKIDPDLNWELAEVTGDDQIVEPDRYSPETDDRYKHAAEYALPLLTGDQEAALGKMIQMGIAADYRAQTLADDDPEKAQLRLLVEAAWLAREEFIIHNLRLPFKFAARWAKPRTPFEDLMQEAYIGMFRAVEKFDPSRGSSFGNYAIWWIRATLSRASAKMNHIQDLPFHLVELFRVINRTDIHLRNELARNPTYAEIGEALNIPSSAVEECIIANTQPVSLQTPVGENESDELGDLIPDPNSVDPAEVVVNRSFVNSAIVTALNGSGLTEDERAVVILRFGLGGENPHNLTQIQKRLRIREGVGQIEARALEKMRKNPADILQKARTEL